MPVTWECPQCRRRVPAALQECRCGAYRPQPATRGGWRRPSGPSDIPGPRFSWRDLPRSVKATLAVMVLALVGGIAWVVLVPWVPDPVPPLLGYVDRPAPIPPSTTTPAKPPPPTPEAAPAEAEPAPAPTEQPPQ
jgi:hypothetical protein